MVWHVSVGTDSQTVEGRGQPLYSETKGGWATANSWFCLAPSGGLKSKHSGCEEVTNRKKTSNCGSCGDQLIMSCFCEGLPQTVTQAKNRDVSTNLNRNKILQRFCQSQKCTNVYKLYGVFKLYFKSFHN